MMLAGINFDEIKTLIDRGIAADQSFPRGARVPGNNSDKARSVRAGYFEQTAKELAGVFPVEIVEAEAITDRHDVLFYFTGLAELCPTIHTLDILRCAG